MGLHGPSIQKSVTLCKGVRLNFGKTGMSVTTGMKGFHEPFNLSNGNRTTSIGIPGTGIYYTTMTSGKKQNSAPSTAFERPSKQTSLKDNGQRPEGNGNEPIVLNLEVQPDSTTDNTLFQSAVPQSAGQLLTEDALRNLYRVCDEKIDWFELMSNAKPKDDLFDPQIWAYFHHIALSVCQGDTDAYLKVVQDINPFDDLLEYAVDFEIEAKSADEVNVFFCTRPEVLPKPQNRDFLWNYVCCCAVRTARDVFALLPVEEVNVTVEHENAAILQVVFSRAVFDKIHFTYSDAVDIVRKFQKSKTAMSIF